MQDVYLEGRWQPATSASTFRGRNPSTGESLGLEFPVCDWAACDRAIDSAAAAFSQMPPADSGVVAGFLNQYADAIDANAEAIASVAAKETALPLRPRLADVELPRTTNQLRLAAAASREARWRLPTWDEGAGLASGFDAIGPVAIFGPNNFPLAFNALAGGDFAAAVAAGNPVIAKTHPSHPNTSLLLANLATEIAERAELPNGFFQVLWDMERDAGLRLVGDHRLGAAAFTGSRAAGLALKRAADAAGVPFYAELSSVNPVFFLDGAIAKRTEAVADEFADSVLLGGGQFCTCPNLGVLSAGEAATRFLGRVEERFQSASATPLLSDSVVRGLTSACARLVDSGAELLCGGAPVADSVAAFQPTLLRVSSDRFLAEPAALQTEGFGPLTLCVTLSTAGHWLPVTRAIEGSLTGSVYFEAPNDEPRCRELTSAVRRRVGRLIHNKMPTGVAVSPAMNHGGPFPATGHPGFTAVGLPASMRRFAKLDCYDNVAAEHRPPWLRQPPGGTQEGAAHARD